MIVKVHQDLETLSSKRGKNSDNHILSTLFDSRKLIHTIKRHRTLFIALCFFFVAIVHPFDSHKHVKQIDQHALDFWIDHVTTHPARADDRYGLSEMGFRASMYAELVRRGQDEFLPSLEESLWEFIHKPQHLREINSHTKGFGSQLRGKFMRRPHDSKLHSRGIVMCVTTKTAHLAFAQIEAIHRVLHSKLTIEVFFYGQGELPSPLQQAFETLPGVTTADLMTSGMFDENLLHHEELDVEPRAARQALSLLATNFTEIVYLEPEAVLLVDPETMFEAQDYQKTGTLFFRRAQTFPNSGGVRFLKMLQSQLDKEQPSLSLANSPFWNFEVDQYQSSGVALFDRKRPGVFVALLYNAWLHSAQPRETLWNIHFRDMTQEILWLAFELARIPYSFVPASPGGLGYIDDKDPNQAKICDPKPLHFAQGARGASSLTPAWFEGPLVLDPQYSVYFRPNGYVQRGKWEPQQTQWCVSGSKPVALSEENRVNGTLSYILEQLVLSSATSAQRYQGLLSYFSEE